MSWQQLFQHSPWAELLCLWVVLRVKAFNLAFLSMDDFGRGLSPPCQYSSAQCLSCSAVFPGELINWLALDREHQGHHHMTVLVTDHGSPPRNATMVVYVTITDINDNRPFFPQCLPGNEFHIKVCEVAFRWACNAFISHSSWAPSCGQSCEFVVSRGMALRIFEQRTFTYMLK